MSILRSLIDSVKSAVSNEAFERVKARDLHDELLQTIQLARFDYNITAEEVADIKQLASRLEITSTELQKIKHDLLEDVVNHALADNHITPEEKALIQEVEDCLQYEPEPTLQAQLEKLKQMG
ncbi:MAG: hypothetical protein HC913_13685 [Microscillaceae bacterium]|nr:hypothetical protein [Microscillaceae bacterium]